MRLVPGFPAGECEVENGDSSDQHAHELILSGLTELQVPDPAIVGCVPREADLAAAGPRLLAMAADVGMLLLGGMLALWGIVTVGWRNTSGVKDGFVSSGPYRFTRNPQYVGDIVFFIGVGVIANSVYLWIAHLLLALWFALAPLAEEPWLEEQYGHAYREYRGRVPRFF